MIGVRNYLYSPLNPVYFSEDEVNMQCTYNFKVGNIECTSILDSVWELNLSDLYPDVQKDQFDTVYSQYKISPIKKFDISCLFLKTEKHNILIDTGWGESAQPDTGMLLPNMQKAGINPGEIDIIIHTHGHPDHIGGNTNANSRLNFPNARHYMSKAEMDFWSSNPDLADMGDKKSTTLACVSKNLLSIKDRFYSVGDSGEILPGLKLIKTAGHSPGHSACIVTTGSNCLLCVGDVFHNPLGILKPEWRMIVDNPAEDAEKSRMLMIEMASSANALVFGNHLPFPGVGYIIKKGDVYLWKPL
jgi:glyoxylase-like metal-dependent hydrolase (beta-lactamase superfamily II)